MKKSAIRKISGYKLPDFETSSASSVDTSKMIKIGEASRLLGISIDTLRRWERKGWLKTYKTPGGTRLYDRTQLQKLNPSLKKGPKEVISPLVRVQAKNQEVTEQVEAADTFKSVPEPVQTISINLQSDQSNLSETKKILPEIIEETRYAKAETFSPSGEKIETVYIKFKRTLFNVALLFIITSAFSIPGYLLTDYIINTKTVSNIGSALNNLPFSKSADFTRRLADLFSPGVSQKLFSKYPPGSPPGLMTRKVNKELNPAQLRDLGYLNGGNFSQKNGSVLAESTPSGSYLQLNLDTQINGTLSVDTASVSGKLFADTVNTGFGDNEVYPMDQALLTSSSVSFSSISGGTINLSGASNQITLANTIISTQTNGSGAYTVSIPTLSAAGNFVIDNVSQTLTNKTISGSSNTFSDIPTSALSSSAITINTAGTLTGGGSVSLGGSITITGAASGVTSIAGTSNQVIASASTGDVTLSLPQDIATTSSPTFAGVLLSGSTSGTLTLNAAATTTSYTLTLPADDGTNNYVLTTDGSGATSWQAVGGGACSNCILSDPSTSQTITPTSATAIGLSIAQASGGSVDVFNVTNNAGSTKYFQVNSSGNISIAQTLTLGTGTVGLYTGAGAPSNGLGADGDYYFRNDGTTGNSSIYYKVSSAWISAGGGSLQNAYDVGSTITTTSGNSVAITLADVATPTQFSITQQDPAGTSAFYLNNNNASGTNTNGILVEQTGAGAMTNGINITRTAGTLTNGLNFSGTFTNLINSPTFVVSNAGAISGVTGYSQASGAFSATGLSSGSISVTGASLALATVTSGDITATTATGTGLFNVITGNLKVGDGTPTLTQDGEDAYVEGTFEVDGVSTFGGNVGIGTTAPASSFHVYSGNAISGYFDSSTAVSFWQIRNSSTGYAAGSSDGLTVGANGLDTFFWNRENGFNYFGTFDTARMSISSSGGVSIGSTYYATNTAANNLIVEGNVGIGDSSPTAKLEVGNGTDSLQVSSVGDITFVDADGGASITGSAGGALLVTAPATNLNLQSDGSIDVNIAGGSSATGCTVANASGDLTCTGNITGSGSGTVGFWSRSGTTLSPATSNDIVSISSNTAGSVFTATQTSSGYAGVFTGGNVGIGTTAPTRLLDVTKTSTATSGINQDGGYFTYIANPGSITSSGTYYDGLVSSAQSTANGIDQSNTNLRGSTFVSTYAGNSTLGSAVGSVAAIYNTSSGTVTGSVGLQTALNNTGTGTITNARGILVGNITNSGGGAITSLNGVTISNQSGATNNTNLLIGTTTIPTGTVNYSIYNSSTYDNYFAGVLGINDTTPTEAEALVTRSTSTLTTGTSEVGSYNIFTFSPASAPSSASKFAFDSVSAIGGSADTSAVTSYAGYFQVSNSNTDTVGTGANGVGVMGDVYNTSTGKAGALVALQGRVNNQSTGTITTSEGLNILAAINSGGGTVTTNYGILVAAQTVGTSDYGARIDAADTQTLWISGNADNTTAAAGIAFGASRDTNLYRSAANILYTDDAFTSGGASITSFSTTNEFAFLGGADGNIELSDSSDNFTYVDFKNLAAEDYDGRIGYASATDNMNFYIAGSASPTLQVSATTMTFTGTTVTASSLATVTTAATLGMTSTTTLNLGTSATINAAATALNIQADGTPDVNIAGGSSATGCTIANASGDLTCSGNITGSGTIGAWSRNSGSGYTYLANASDNVGIGTSTPTSKLYVNATQTSGTVFNLSYGSATTLAGDLTGLYVDLNSGNVDATNQNLTGVNFKIPTVTDTHTSGTKTLTGMLVNFGSGAGINQNGAGGTLEYIAGDFHMPALTQTAGTLNAYGVKVTTPATITTGGTAYGYYISATGVGAGTLSGLGISSITGGAGTEYALNVGTGWDAVLRVGSTTIINGSGVTQEAGGGTSESTYTTGDILYASAANTLDKLAIGNTDGYVLKVSGGVPVWGTVTGGSCTNCLISDPSSTQTIAPTGAATQGLSVRQTSTALGGNTQDIFNVTSSDGSTRYFYVDYQGNVSSGSISNTNVTITPTNDSTALTLVGTNVTSAKNQYINTKNSSGTIFDISYGAAQTLAGTIIGQNLDLSTNVTATNQSASGQVITLPAATNTSGTQNYKGLVITGGSLNENGGTATNFYGADITIPALTQTSGALTAYGIQVDTPSSITTGGTAYGFQVNATGVGAGTLVGMDITNITAGAGTETGLQIGSGWDTNLLFNDTTSIVGLANGGTLSFNDSAGNNLCTITDGGTTGSFACTGNITGPTSGTVGYWSRSSTTLSPATANDIVSISSNDASNPILSLTASGTTTGNSVSLASNALTTGNAISVSSTSTAGGASGSSYLINLSRSGANSNTAHTAYGIYSSVTNTNGTSGTNIAGYFTASGATTNNYALATNGTASNVADSKLVAFDGNLQITSNYQALIKASSTINPSSASTATFSTLKSVPYSQSDNLSGAAINAFEAIPYFDPGSAATYGSVRGYYVRAYAATANATITNNYGIVIDSPDSTGTIGTNYGLYFEDQTGGDTTDYAIYIAGADNYALYSADSGALSYFAGNVGIGGDTSPNSLLAVGDGTDEFQVDADGDVVFVDANSGSSITGPAGGSLTLTAPATSLELQVDGSINVNIAGGSSATGCTVTNSNGNLTCTGNITGSSSGTVGFWSRSSTTLSPATANDIVSIATTNTTGSDLGITNTGVYTGNGVVNLIANSATTGNLLSLTTTGMTSGEVLNIDGTWAPTDASNNEAIDINITNAPTGSANTLRAMDLTVTDSTALANVTYGYRSTISMTGNAAKVGRAVEGNVTSSSTTADSLNAGYFTTTATGNAARTGNITLFGSANSSSTTADNLSALYGVTSATGILTTGTRNNYGVVSQPASTAASTGGTNNIYGAYLNPSSTLSNPGATDTATNNVFGASITTVATTAADCTTNCATNQYGIIINDGTSSTNGTSYKAGLYVSAQTGADVNVGAYFGSNVGVNDTTPDAWLDIDAATTSTGAFGITDTGVHTGTTTSSVAHITANSTTTGTVLHLSATGMTSGTILNTTGTWTPTAGGLVNGVGIAATYNPNTTAGTFRGMTSSITDTSTLASTTSIAGLFFNNSTGNAASKSIFGAQATAWSSSTTADLTYGALASTSVTGVITTGTRTSYGIMAAPASTAASTGGTMNMYAGYFAPSSTLSNPGGTDTATNRTYGVYTSTTLTLASDCAASCTSVQYGAYIDNGTSSTNGTSTKYGMFINNQTGADTNYHLYVSATSTATSGVNQNGGYFNYVVNPGGATSATTYYDNIIGSITTSANATDHTNSVVRGGVFVPTHAGSGTLGNANGVSAAVYNTSTGTITTAQGYNSTLSQNSGTISSYSGYIASVNSNAGTLTSTYGYYVGDITTGTQTNQAYGLYVSDASARNYFAGNVGIGTSTPSTFILQVTGHVGPSTDDTYDLGDNTHRWRDIYLGPATAHVGTSTTDEGTIAYDTTNNIFQFGTDSTANGDIAFFTDDLYLDKSSGNVGIGTTAPGFLLTVTGGTGITDAEFALTDPTTSSKTLYMGGQWLASEPTIGTNTTYGLNFATNNTRRMTINSDGNVGIGTIAPTSIFHVNSTGDGNLGVGQFYSNPTTDGNQTSIIIGKAASTQNSSVIGFRYDTTATDVGTFIANYGESIGDGFFQEYGGNVGIGTTGPVGQLDVTDTSNTAPSFNITNNTATTLGAGVNTTGIFDFQSTSLTTGNLLNMEANALTTGTMLGVSSTSTALAGTATTGKGLLGNFDWTPGSATTASGDLFRLKIGPNGTTTGSLFNIVDDTSSIFAVSETAFTTSLPSNFTASGDVSVAYDIQFTNPTASYIKSAAPLTMVAGETFNSSNLTLQTYNTGSIVLETTTTGSTLVPYGNVGIGTSSPSTYLHIKGNNNTNRGQLSLEATDYAMITYYSGPTTTTNLEMYDYYDVANSERVIQVYNNGSFGELNMNPSGGNIGIATSSPDTLFHVNSSAVTTGAHIGASFIGVWTGSTGYMGVSHNSLRATSGSFALYQGSSGDTYLNSASGQSVFIRTANGIITNSTTGHYLCYNSGSGALVYGASCASSSRTTKHDINSLSEPSGLDTVMQLNPVSFVYNEDQNADPGQMVGFIAEEAEAVDPRLVIYGSDGNVQSFRYENLTAILTKAVQQLNRKVDNIAVSSGQFILDAEGYLQMGNVKMDKIIVSGDVNISGKATALSFNLDASKFNMTGALASVPVDPTGTVSIADTINALDDKLSDVELENASQSAELAEAKILGEQAIAQAESLDEKVASTSANLASLSAQIQELLNSTSDSTDSSSLPASPSDGLTPPAELLTASSSATLANLTVSDKLSAVNLSAMDATVSATLKSLGETFLGNTTIAGDISIDGTFSVSEGKSLNAFPTLYIQNSPLAMDIDIFNGNVRIGKTGNIEAEALALGDQSVGTATITAGQTEITIPSTLITATSRVFLTPMSAVSGNLYISQLTNGSGFKVKISQPNLSDVKFNWLIIGEKQ